MSWWTGKKTMIGAVAAGALVIFRALFPEVLDDQTAQVFAGIILTWTGISLRLAVKK